MVIISSIINKQLERNDSIKKAARELLIQEEEKIHRVYLTKLLADVIGLHYKYFKNKEFDTFEQYLNGYKSFLLVESRKEQIKLYREVDDLLLNNHSLFFAHYMVDKPIFCVSVEDPS